MLLVADCLQKWTDTEGVGEAHASFWGFGHARRPRTPVRGWFSWEGTQNQGPMRFPNMLLVADSVCKRGQTQKAWAKPTPRFGDLAMLDVPGPRFVDGSHGKEPKIRDL